MIRDGFDFSSPLQNNRCAGGFALVKREESDGVFSPMAKSPVIGTTCGPYG